MNPHAHQKKPNPDLYVSEANQTKQLTNACNKCRREIPPSEAGKKKWSPFAGNRNRRQGQETVGRGAESESSAEADGRSACQWSAFGGRGRVESAAAVDWSVGQGGSPLKKSGGPFERVCKRVPCLWVAKYMPCPNIKLA